MGITSDTKYIFSKKSGQPPFWIIYVRAWPTCREVVFTLDCCSLTPSSEPSGTRSLKIRGAVTCMVLYVICYSRLTQRIWSTLTRPILKSVVLCIICSWESIQQSPCLDICSELLGLWKLSLLYRFTTSYFWWNLFLELCVPVRPASKICTEQLFYIINGFF